MATCLLMERSRSTPPSWPSYHRSDFHATPGPIARQLTGSTRSRDQTLSPLAVADIQTKDPESRPRPPRTRTIGDRALSTQSSTLLLDIRDRQTFGEGHEKGAVNIPFEEVLLRGPAELPVSRHIVIDCRDPLDLGAMAVHWLASNGFGQVSILRR